MSKETKTDNGAFTFTLTDEELASREMVYILMTMLQSRGYKGFGELFTAVNDPVAIIRIIRLLYGMTIEIPPLKEVNKCMKAAMYTFCDMHKMINTKLPAKPKDIREYLKINKDEEAELLEIFDKWSEFMHKEGIDLTAIMHINRNNTKKRIKMSASGKKWKAEKY